MAGEKRERTRKRLIDAAFAVVGERGFHAASVDSIAERAQLSTGALYANFDNKDALLFAAFDEHLRWFADSLEATAGAADLNAAIAGWLRRMGEEPEQFLIFVEFWAYAVRRPGLREQLGARLEEMRGALAARIEERAAGDGVATPLPPALTAQIALALARGLVFEVAAEPDSVDVAAIADLLAALVAPQG